MTLPHAPEQRPPLLEVTPLDHRAWIAVAAALGLCCALVTLLLRAFVRAVISPPFGHDDSTILAATVFGTIQSSVVLYAVSQGLGLSVDLIKPGNLLTVEKAAYASDILYLLSVYLAKCSVVFLLLRLTPSRQHRLAFNGTLLALTIWLIASVFTIALRCDLLHPWVLFQQKCTALLLRWQIVVALDIVTELLLFAMSVYLIYGLHMAFKNKCIVLGAFGFRLMIIPFLIVRIISFPRHHLSADPAFNLTYFYVWTQTTLYISLMVTTIPCLKPFVAGLNTGYGAFDTEHVATRAYGSSYGSNGYGPRKNHRTKRSSNLPSHSAFDLHSGLDTFNGDDIRRKRATAEEGVVSPTGNKNMEISRDPRVTGRDEELGEGKATNHATAVAQDGNSIGSNDSRQMIIRKDVAWAVEYSAP